MTPFEGMPMLAAKHAPHTWFHVTYFDGDWQEIEELAVEDATWAEALNAVLHWMEARVNVDKGLYPAQHPLAMAENIDVEATHEP